MFLGRSGNSSNPCLVRWNVKHLWEMLTNDIHGLAPMAFHVGYISAVKGHPQPALNIIYISSLCFIHEMQYLFSCVSSVGVSGVRGVGPTIMLYCTYASLLWLTRVYATTFVYVMVSRFSYPHCSLPRCNCRRPALVGHLIGLL